MKRFFDWALGLYVVMWLLSLPTVWIVARIRGLERREIAELVDVYYPILRVIILAGCGLLLFWMLLGQGARSSLWKWLPPFVLMPVQRAMWRWVVVGVLIGGTLLALGIDYVATR